MKKLILALTLLVGLSGKSFAGNPPYPSPGKFVENWVPPVVFSATSTSMAISSMGFTPTELTGNPTYSTLTAITNSTQPYYTSIHVQNVDPNGDLYVGYGSNTSTSTTQGIPGAGNQGMRLCATSPIITIPPTCPPDQVFYVMPYQSLFAVSGSTGPNRGQAVVIKWR